MHCYFVRLSIAPAVMLQDEINIDVTDEPLAKPRVRITNRQSQSPDGHTWISGLQFDVELVADKLETAVAIALALSEDIATTIALSTSIGLPRPQLELAYDIEPNVREHSFTQIVDLQLPPSSRRWLYPPHLQELVLALGNLPQGRRKVIIEWSMKLHRRALQITEPVEAFAMEFLALEALEYSLGEKNGRSEDPGERLPGIRKLFETFPEGALDYKRCKELRNGFAHAKPDLPFMTREAVELAPKMREVLVDAYCRFLGIQPKTLMLVKPIVLPEKMQLKVETVLVQTQNGPMGEEGGPPHFDLKLEGFGVKTQSDHHTALDINVKLRKRFASDVECESVNFEILGGQEISDVEGRVAPNR